MFDHDSRWSAENEGYWQAIVTQGKWAETAPPPSMFESRDAQGRTPAGYDPSHGSDDQWRTLDEYFNSGDTLSVPVVGYNKGGLLVEWNGLQGFVPASQLSDCARRLDDSLPERMAYLSEWVGRTIEVKIIELERPQNRIIFSERASIWQGRCPDDVIESLQPGDVCRGRVSNLCDFGVFVDLGGIDGLIHVSELSWRRVNHPRDVLSAGQEVEVYVIDVDHDRRRIALSLKRLQSNPWQTVAERYHVGQIIDAVITNVVDFGAFARIEDGVEGLLHISELGAGDVPLHPRSVLYDGQHIRARILNIDPDNQRMGLTMREVPQPGSQPSAVFDVRRPLPQRASTYEATPSDGRPIYD